LLSALCKNYSNCPRQTQDISPQTHRCSGPLKLSSEQLVILAQLIDTSDDATLEELCELLHEKIGVTVSRATMGRMTQRLKITFKKNALSVSQRQ